MPTATIEILTKAGTPTQFTMAIDWADVVAIEWVAEEEKP